MKTRKATLKKTPPAKKPAVKSQATPTSTVRPIVESPETPIMTPKPNPTPKSNPAPKSSDTNRSPATRSKKVATSTEAVIPDATPSPATTGKESSPAVSASASSICGTPLSSSSAVGAVGASASSTDAKPADGATRAPDVAGQTSTGPKRGTVKVIRKVVRKVLRRVPKSASGQTPKSGEPNKPLIEEHSEKNVGMTVQRETVDNCPQTAKGDATSSENVDEKLENKGAIVMNVDEKLVKEGVTVVNVDQKLVKEGATVVNVDEKLVKEGATVVNVDEKLAKEGATVVNVDEKLVNKGASVVNVDEKVVNQGAPVVNVDEKVVNQGAPVVNVDEKVVKATVVNVDDKVVKEGATVVNVDEKVVNEGATVVNVDEKVVNEGATVVSTVHPMEGLTNSSVAKVTKREKESAQTDKICTVISSKHLQKQGIVAMEVNSTALIDQDKPQKEANLREVQEGQPRAVEDQAELTEEHGEEPIAVEAGWKGEKVAMDEDPKEEKTDFDSLLEEADDDGIADHEFHDEVGRDDSERDMMERCEEAMKREEEHAELDAVAQERRLRKEFEIFVGGLDRDVVEEDLKRVFRHAGEVVDVRLYKDPTTNKNKGYGFVRFAAKEHVTRALAEMKNPVIRGKRCGIAPNEDNDTLFVGNICNTWTKEAIKQKLKDYGIKSVERITLVTDPKYEGLSRGFAFVEFSCHAEAMKAYNRLQKPDVVLGHAERTAKVAFAEPLREPDPEVMAKVKSVFIDGLPPHWDEDRLRTEFKQFGSIVQIMLARNMPSAKRKDFGFADFTTHEAAVACVEGINNTELGDGNNKAKVRVRLANPKPKTQAVKGEMAGGFRIARSGGGTFSRQPRGLGRAAHAFNRGNFQPGRGFYPHGPDFGGRMGFGNGRGFGGPYPPFHEGQNFGHGGGRWGFRSAHPMPSEGPPPIRPNLDRFRSGAHDVVRRQPFMPEEGLERPFPGRQFDNPYFYEDSVRGMKRPYHMNDQHPDFVGPSTRRTRYDYAEPLASVRDGLGPGGGPHPQDYHASNYRGGMPQSFYEGDRSYGHGYYY